MKIKVRKKNNVDCLLILTIISNILIPKAGIKVGEIPITIGNIFLMILLVQFFFNAFRQKQSLLKQSYALVLVAGYWLMRFSLSILGGRVSWGETFPYLIALVVYPMVFWPVLKKIKTEDQTRAIFLTIEKCILIVMGYGILQYLVGIGKCAIPGITVNFTDYAQNPTGWWLAKSNAFGEGSSKIISTYQNGNILGLSLVLLFPIVFRIPDRKLFNRLLFLLLFVVISVLTGSRSVMIGMVFYFFLLVRNAVRTGKIPKRRFLFGLLSVIFGTVVVGWFLSSRGTIDLVQRLSKSLNWNIFSRGAGRTEQAFRYLRWLFSGFRPLAWLFGAYGSSYEGGAYEMTYVCVMVLGGIVGLFIFMYPLLAMVKRFRRALSVQENWMLRGIMEGIVVWMVTAFFEGAYWLPPTAINLWTVGALGEVVLQIENRRWEK